MNVGHCQSCKHFNVRDEIGYSSPQEDGVEGRDGWGYCQRMRTDSHYPEHFTGQNLEDPATLAFGIDASYGRGDRVEVVVSPEFGCVMFEPKA